MKRRTLLSLLAAGSASASLAQPGQRARDGREHVLILLELRGGNDGLNTVIPHKDPLYLAARPSLAVTNGPPLNERLSLHPALAPLLPLWQQRKLCFALGVGWPKPNRSHFKAADQWATANPSGEGNGWLAEAFAPYRRSGPLVALGPSGCDAMEGTDTLALQLSSEQLLQSQPGSVTALMDTPSPVLRRLLEMEQEGQRELELLRRHLKALPAGIPVGRGGINQQISLALRLLDSGVSPPVLQLFMGGFDTHFNQAPRHERLLTEVASALATLDAGLRQLKARPRVTLLAVSEFGRRERENCSKGTDHGSASVAFLYGDDIAQSFIGSYPDLGILDSRGDLIATMDPIDLYRHALAGTQVAGWRA
jgi:uncharacterized protein (DUF1501 family)